MAFLERMAAAPELGPAAWRVAKVAARLVDAMRRNWITEGRRPAG